MKYMNFKLPTYPENQTAMKKYMQSQFEFNGVRAPERHLIERQLWQSVKQFEPSRLMQLIDELYQQSTREYQYVAIDLALRAVRRWRRADLEHLMILIVQKSWWDSIDEWRKVFSAYVKYRPDEFDWVSHLFLGADNFWLRRIAITLQLSFYDQTDVGFLVEAITADIDTDEFFIQKAIGWALRNYGKVNPNWVVAFVASHDLMTFAQREALKNIKK